MNWILNIYDRLMVIQEIRWLHRALSFSGNWTIETKDPGGDLFEELADRSAIKARAKLQSISWWMLYYEYLKWLKSNPIIYPDREWFDNFLDDLAFSFVRRTLRGLERDIFETMIQVRVQFRQDDYR